MKFSCPKCATRYSIAKEKVPAAKNLRFSCKKCGNVIRLRRKSETPQSENKVKETLSPSEAISEKQSAKKKPPPPPKQSIARWHVLVAGQQEGPVSEDDVQRLLKERQLDRQSHAWRDGMQDWERLGAIDEFRELSNSLGDASWRLRASTREPNPDQSDSQEPPQSPEPTQVIQRDALKAALAKTKRTTTELNESIRKTETPSFVHVPEKSKPQIDYGSQGELSQSQNSDSSARSSTSSRPTNNASASGSTGRTPIESAPSSSNRARSQDLVQQEKPATEYIPQDPVELLTKNNATSPEATQVFVTKQVQSTPKQAKQLALTIGISFVVIASSLFYLHSNEIWHLPGLEPPYSEVLKNAPAREPIALIEEPRPTKRDYSAGKRHLSPRKPPEPKSPLQGPQEHLSIPEEKKNTEKDPEIVEQASPIKKEMLANIFDDDRKIEAAISLQRPQKIKAVNLPDGLTADAILQVISSNNVSIKLCMDQAIQRGEKLRGRMDIEIIINPKGAVTKVNIQTVRFKNSTIGECARKRIKLWRFPTFNGQQIPVQFPYVLSTSL